MLDAIKAMASVYSLLDEDGEDALDEGDAVKNDRSDLPDRAAKNEALNDRSDMDALDEGDAV